MKMKGNEWRGREDQTQNYIGEGCKEEKQDTEWKVDKVEDVKRCDRDDHRGFGRHSKRTHEIVLIALCTF